MVGIWRTRGACRYVRANSSMWRPRWAPTSRSFCPAERRLASAAVTRSIRWPICRVTGSCCSIPGFGVRLVDAYGWYDAERDLARGPIVREAQYVPGPWPSRAAQMINDLEAPIAGIIPKSSR